MKTTTLIFAALFSFQASFLFAGNNDPHTAILDRETVSVNLINLIPIIPQEATFEDVSETGLP